MTQDQFEDQPQKPRSGGGRLVAAGVVGACALGVGLGLWARPAGDEGPAAARPPAAAKPAKPPQGLQIIVDDSPAPIGRPLEVLPADLAPDPAADTAPPLPVEPSMMAPRRPPSGLMKVAAPVAAEPVEPAVLPVERAEPKPQPAIRRGARPEPKKTKIAAAKPKPKPQKALAKAEKPPAKARPQKVRQVEFAKAGKKDAKSSKTGKSKAKATEVAKADKKSTRLSKLASAVKSAPNKLKAAATTKPKPAELAKAKAAKAKPVKTARAQKPAKVKVAKASAPKPQPRKPAAKPKAVGEGPMRVARGNGCVSSDPGEALACADPRLSVRERQLQRAYRQAEASGVPAATLRRQQERWRAARAAAAREAPWAVEEVYEARIAELNDMSRSAAY